MFTFKEKLLATNDLHDLQTWVCILLQCKVGLRSDCLKSLTIDSIKSVWNLAVIHPNGTCDALAIRFKGKSEKDREVTLMIYSEWKFPALCPVKHLMAYIHFSGIKSGFLFPPLQFWSTLKVNDYFLTKQMLLIYLLSILN